MKPQPDPGTALRLVLAGSTSPLGRELQELLEGKACEWDVALIETGQYESLIEEFGAHIDVVGALTNERIESSEVVILACGPQIVNDYLERGAGLPRLTIDLSGAPRPGPIFVRGLSGAWQSPSQVVAVPRAEAIVLGHLLQRLDDAGGVSAAEATVLVPASEHGIDGVERLERETAEVLNFRRPGPLDGRTTAFNVIVPDPTSRERKIRISRQIGALGGARCPAPSLQYARIPLLHGMVLSIHVRTGREITEEEALDILTRNGGDRTVVSGACTPAEVSGSDRIHVTHVEEGGDPGAMWLWVVVDNTRLVADNVMALLDAYRAARDS